MQSPLVQAGCEAIRKVSQAVWSGSNADTGSVSDLVAKPTRDMSFATVVSSRISSNSMPHEPLGVLLRLRNCLRPPLAPPSIRRYHD